MSTVLAWARDYRGRQKDRKGSERKEGESQDLHVPSPAPIWASQKKKKNTPLVFPAGETEPLRVHTVKTRLDHESQWLLVRRSRASSLGTWRKHDHLQPNGCSDTFAWIRSFSLWRLWVRSPRFASLEQYFPKYCTQGTVLLVGWFEFPIHFGPSLFKMQ